MQPKRLRKSAITSSFCAPRWELPAVAQPNLDLYNSFNTLAGAAGIASTFDPFANDLDFLIGAYIFEDVGVTAYSGAAPLLTQAPYLAAAAGILGTEAYHAGLVRTSIFIADPDGKAGLQGYTQKISATRMSLDGSSTTDDIGVGLQTVTIQPAGTMNGAATIVDAQTGSPNYSKTYSRTTTQVLKIVTGSANIPASGSKYTGVFFPNGLNGLFS